jgi:hypothetical protein
MIRLVFHGIKTKKQGAIKNRERKSGSTIVLNPPPKESPTTSVGHNPQHRLLKIVVQTAALPPN